MEGQQEAMKDKKNLIPLFVAAVIIIAITLVIWSQRTEARMERAPFTPYKNIISNPHNFVGKEIKFIGKVRSQLDDVGNQDINGPDKDLYTVLEYRRRMNYRVSSASYRSTDNLWFIEIDAGARNKIKYGIDGGQPQRICHLGFSRRYDWRKEQ